MPKDEKQDSALDRLVNLISTSAQITVLTNVQQYLIEPGESAATELKAWVAHEKARLEKIRDGL